MEKFIGYLPNKKVRMRAAMLTARSVEQAVQYLSPPMEAERIALRDKLENTFRLSTTTEYHTKGSDRLENPRVVNDFIKTERSYLEGEYSQGDVVLEDAHQFWSAFNYMSMSCLVKNGFEINLSKSKSTIFRDGEKILDVVYTGRGWYIDIRKYQGRGKMHISRRESTKNIINKLKNDAIKASTKDGDISTIGSEVADIDKMDDERKNPSNTIFSQWTPYQQRWERSRNNFGFKERSVAWVLDIHDGGHSVCFPENLHSVSTSYKGYKRGCVVLGEILLDDVTYEPGNQVNIFSLLRLAEDGYEFKFTKKEATITKEGKTYLKAPMVGNFWILNSVHEKHGWLDGKCPYEKKDMLSFKQKYSDEFTMGEIKEAFKEFTHDCELEGPRKETLFEVATHDSSVKLRFVPYGLQSS